jgi:hypothetical protein
LVIAKALLPEGPVVAARCEKSARSFALKQF